MKKILLTSMLATIIGIVALSLSKRESITPGESVLRKSVNRVGWNSEHEIAEAVLRHLLANNGSGSVGGELNKFNACYLSLDLTKYDEDKDYQYREDEFQHGHTPPQSFMECFQDLKLPLLPVPSNAWFPSLTITRSSNRNIVFYIDGIIGQTPESAKVMAGFYYHPQNAGEYEYTVEYSNGEWQVRTFKCIGIS